MSSSDESDIDWSTPSKKPITSTPGEKQRQKEIKEAKTNENPKQANSQKLNEVGNLARPEIVRENKKSKEKQNRPEMEVKMSIKDIYHIVPEFGGSPNELDKFISCGNLFFTNTQSADEQTVFPSIIKTRLKDSAFELIKYKTIDTWKDLKQELQNNFKQEKSRNIAQSDLMSAKQNFKESVSEFGDRLLNTLSILNEATYASTENAAIREYLINENTKLAIQAFEDGLRNPTLKILIKAKGETDLKKAISVAIEESSRLERTAHQHSNISKPPSSRPTCQICHKEGHTKETCFRNTNLPQFPNRQANNEIRYIRCSYCQKPNHTYRECRQRLARNFSNQYTPNFQRSQFTNSNFRENKIPPQNNQNANASFKPKNVRYSTTTDTTSTSRVTCNDQENGQGNMYSREEEFGGPSRVCFKADVHSPMN